MGPPPLTVRRKVMLTCMILKHESSLFPRLASGSTPSPTELKAKLPVGAFSGKATLILLFLILLFLESSATFFLHLLLCLPHRLDPPGFEMRLFSHLNRLSLARYVTSISFSLSFVSLTISMSPYLSVISIYYFLFFELHFN